MTDPVQKQLSPYKNENLFSRHYLKKVIQRTSIWEVDEDEIEEAFEELEEIYDEQKDLLPHRTDDEEEVRNEFITPVLRRVLDFKKEQEKKSGNSQRIPDYALYDNNEKKKKAVESQEYYKHAIGLVEAKAWKKDLEKKTSTGSMSTDNSNPTKQIVDYLIENDPQWGILTNGNKWRLVNRDASNRLDTYYEVNIENLLTSDRPREERLEEFKYFYIFFRKQAFQGDEGDKVLDEILDESLQYAEEIGEDLEENIYQALEWLAKGYLNNGQNDGIEDEPIDRIHDNSLIYLYRLLFALYADSRGILGDPSGMYDDYNFSELVDEVCGELDEGDGYGKSGLIRNRLDAIFRMIDEGSQSQGIPKEELHIPAYNGGLFNQDKHEFLKEYKLHDEYLAKVIDLVARTKREEGSGKAQVDYYDLSVRHLGGIYEGLLEYQLEKADEKMVKVKEDGSEVVKTLEEAEEDGDSFSDNDIIEEREPYLVTDDGERKATGSYYTPDYIVKYIVENTVGPKVEEEIEGLETDEEKAEVILDMQILDPAMGSAHFLVEVIDYLATELVDHKEIEIEQAKREVARQCVYGVDVNPLATELGKLSIWLKTISEDKPLSFLDHHIKTGNSLIGADIHDINRHPEEDEDSKRQVTIGEEFGEENAGVVRANVQEMLKKFKEIQEKQADSPEDIKEQEELYQEFLGFPFRKRFDVLADVYTSHYFENDYKVDDYNRLLQAFKLSEQKEEGDEEWNKVIKEDWVQKATDSLNNSHEENNISNQKGFFHWKLEFPEVFFDIEEGVEKPNAGFDAVVGNPPYISVQSLNLDKGALDYYKDTFETASGNFDIYNLFIENSLELSDNNSISYILPNKFFNSRYGKSLRRLLTDEFSLWKIVDFNDEQVFESASTYTCLLFLDNSKTELLYDSIDSSDIKQQLDEVDYTEVSKDPITEDNWSFLPVNEQEIIDTIRERGSLLSENVERISQGFATSRDDFYIFNDGKDVGKGLMEVFSEEAEEKVKIESDLLKPLVKGKNIDRYKPWYKGKLVLWPYEDENLIEPEKLSKKYPKAWSYIQNHEDILRSRESGKMDEEGWYGYTYPKNKDIYRKEKILSPANDFEPSFAIDRDSMFYTAGVAGGNGIVSELNYSHLIGLLNSRLLGYFYVRKTGTALRGGYYSYESRFIDDLPILEEKNKKLVSLVDKCRDCTKEIQEEKDNFLEWVKAEWGVSIDDLSLKTHMREYWEHDFDEFMRIAKKNKSQIDGNVKSREFRELMKDEWENSMLTLEPLMNKIDELENEIDAIVFDLYDLNEEEVETVLDSLDAPEGEKASIMEKFDEVRS